MVQWTSSNFYYGTITLENVGLVKGVITDRAVCPVGVEDRLAEDGARSISNQTLLGKGHKVNFHMHTSEESR